MTPGDSYWRKVIWRQFGAAIDAFKNAIDACPDELWEDTERFHQVWYMAYHTLFWLDYNLTADSDNFSPLEPFNLDELDPRGILPERVYSKEEMLNYLQHCRKKCRRTVLELSPDRAEETVSYLREELSFAELLLYTMRHVQHHAAQINLILRQETNSAPGWVFTAG